VALTLANAIAYVQLGIDAGLEVDEFMPRFTFLALGGSMDFFKEIARARATRRMWAKIMRERFGAKNPRSWMLRGAGGAMIGFISTTAQRPLNNLTRAVIGGVASALSGGPGMVIPPYDEPLGLGWSLEAQQLSTDAARIIQYEAKLCDVLDPLAGSYYIEALTDEIEAEAWDLIHKIDSMGGAVAAIEKGFYQQEIAKSAYQFQKEIESGERVVVGVNRFLGEHELEVSTTRLVEHPYDPVKRAQAEEKQIQSLKKVKKERDNDVVGACLRRLKEAARDESVNLIPPILEAVKAYASVGEMCHVLREVFGGYQIYTAVA